MAELKINLKDEEVLRTAIKAREYLARYRLLTLEQLNEIIKEVESKLLNVMNKSDWEGVIISLDYHADYTRRGDREKKDSTQVTIERCASGWFVTRIVRDRVNSASKRINVYLTPDNEDAIIRFLGQSKNWS